MINADKPHLWKSDVAASVDLYNDWFLQFAPEAFQHTRQAAASRVMEALRHADDMLSITPGTLLTHPDVLPIFRMATAPPLARDRLAGLAQIKTHVVGTLEDGKLPKRVPSDTVYRMLERICAVIARLLDRDIFVWLEENRRPTEVERLRASTVIADRLCGAQSDPIIRNAQEQRQISVIEKFLVERGYIRRTHPSSQPLTAMTAGTYSIRMNLFAGQDRKIKIPIDIVIQPHQPHQNRIPILIECKSAGDFTNPNKRRKEEAQKIRQIREAYGQDVPFLLFLCGYFDTSYLEYEASEGIDWIWEHRAEDLEKLGL